MAVVYGSAQGKIEIGRRPVAVEYQGKQRILYDTITTGATASLGVAPINSGDVWVVGFLPSGTRILPSGMLLFGAFGASTTATVGTYTRSGNTFTAVSAAKYLGSTSVASAGSATLANTAALSAFDKLTQDLYIGVTAGGANYANGIVAHCYVPYVSD